jgi:hypothetical protein
MADSALNELHAQFRFKFSKRDADGGLSPEDILGRFAETAGFDQISKYF